MNCNDSDFTCDRCGACCRLLRLFGDFYSDLDDGTGCCLYYDHNTRLCKIYESRPLKCRIKEGWKAYFSELSYEEYIKKTAEMCKILKEFSEKQRQVKTPVAFLWMYVLLKYSVMEMEMTPAERTAGKMHHKC